MRLSVISDLHLDTLDKKVYKKVKEDMPPADILIVAGDMAVISGASGIGRTTSFFEENTTKYKHILYVAGNHDYWGSSLSTTKHRIRDISRYVSNFHFLDENEEFEFEGIKFVGDTLWFKEEDSLMLQATGCGYSYRELAEMWIDYDRVVCNFGDFQKAHELFLNNKIRGKDLSKTVVITHHMPSYKCIAPEWQNQPTNVFFANDLDKEIIEGKPKMWIFGHTHNPFDFQLGDTRMFCNPRGYPNEHRNADVFNRSLIEL